MGTNARDTIGAELAVSRSPSSTTLMPPGWPRHATAGNKSGLGGRLHIFGTDWSAVIHKTHAIPNTEFNILLAAESGSAAPR